VAGGSGAGKTTLVRALAQRAGPDRVAVVQHDWYYRDHAELPPERRAQLNYDHPDALETDLLVRQLEQLRAGRPVEAPCYDFARHARLAHTRTVEPREWILLDGILLLCDPALRAALDLRVWVEADADLRFIRRLERDLRERSRSVHSVIEQYLQSVRPMHREWVATSQRFADLVLDGQGELELALRTLEAEIAKRAAV
jgi:uridine kinase